jgi:N-acetylmuramoyl-L-alanine amidase
MLLRIFAPIVAASIILIYGFAATQTFYKEPLRVEYLSLSRDSQKEIDCLAENIYFEAAKESRKGQIAVAFVTLNRMKSGRFPDTLCGVVKQKTNSTCQFSWWCESKPYYISTNKLLTKKNNSLYNEIHELATYFYINHDRLDDPSKGALFYHADYVNPKWPNMIRTAVIGRHIFYQKRGYA